MFLNPKKYLISLCVVLSFCVGSVALAEDAASKNPSTLIPPAEPASDATPAPAPAPGAGGGGGLYGLRDPLGNITLQTAIGRVIRYAIGFSGALFLAFFIYGGFLWMLAGGDSAKVTKAQQALKNSALGMGIIILSYSLISLILQFTETLTSRS